jgi:hypothetical protein
MSNYAFGVSSHVDDSLLDLASALPHGGGVNCDWTVTVCKKSIQFHNSFHCMDANGFYDNYADFTVKLPIIDGFLNWREFRLQFNGLIAYRLNKKYDLRSALDDCIYCALVDYFEEMSNCNQG